MIIPITSSHYQWFHQIFIFGPSHVQKVYNPNRSIHLEIGFCEHYCVQMTLSIPGTGEKSSLEREHPFLTEFVLIMNSCFIQYKAPLVEYIKVYQDINSFCQERLVFWQFQKNFIIFEVENCFGNGTRQYSTCLYQSGSSHILFSYHYILSILGKIFHFGISFFNVWQLLHFNYSQCKFFGRSFWSFKYNVIKSQLWF